MRQPLSARRDCVDWLARPNPREARRTHPSRPRLRRPSRRLREPRSRHPSHRRRCCLIRPPDCLASAGRRFSASAEPSELVAAPRRSAASVSTPTSPVTPVRGWTSRPAPTAPRVMQTFEVPTSSPVTQDSEPPSATAPRAVNPPPEAADPAGTRGVVEPGGEGRRSRRALAVIGGVVAIALIVAGVVWGINQNTTSSTPTASATQPLPALDPLLTDADVAGLASASWQVSTTQPTPGSAYPLCIPVTAEGMPVPDRTAERLITSTSTQTDSVKNVVETYADAATAAKAFQERLVQAGTCPDTEALIVSSVHSSAICRHRLRHPDPGAGRRPRPRYHTVLISQTGRNLSLDRRHHDREVGRRHRGRPPWPPSRWRGSAAAGKVRVLARSSSPRRSQPPGRPWLAGRGRPPPHHPRCRDAGQRRTPRSRCRSSAASARP